MKLIGLALLGVVTLGGQCGFAVAADNGKPMAMQQSDDPVAQLKSTMTERRKASMDGDVDPLADGMADEYVQTDISGYRQDKATWLNEYLKPLASLIKTGKFRWDNFEYRDLQFQVFGDCAVVTGKLEAKGTGARLGKQHTWVADPSASFSGTLSFTHVYVRRDGKWLLVALHNSVPFVPPQK